MKALSSTTFVAEVTAPALALVVPLLQRALNDRSMEVQRRTVVVIDNLVKLVRDPNVAAIYLSGLVDGVEKIMKGASFPEVSLHVIASELSHSDRYEGPRIRRGCIRHIDKVGCIKRGPSTFNARCSRGIQSHENSYDQYAAN